MKKQNWVLVCSHALIGSGLFFVYIHYVRSIFETRTHFAHLTQLEREALLRKVDALYYSFYRTIVEAPNFRSGLQQLKNMSSIEYPNAVNVLARFQVLPEIIIGYLFHCLKTFSREFRIPMVSCWSIDAANEAPVACGGIGEPFYFYLEFAWMLGGFTVFILFMYGSYLSGNLFGGIYAVVVYIMFHKNASKIYDRPLARENFAFPFVFWHMLYLCVNIEHASKEAQYPSTRFSVFIKFAILNTVALLSWQFSSFIFAMQIIFVIAPTSLGHVASGFSLDYAISHLAASVLAYYFSFGNRIHLYGLHNGPALALIFVSLTIMYRRNERLEKTPMRALAVGSFLAISCQGAINDLLEKTGFVRPEENIIYVYRDLLLHWLLQRRVNFTTSLLACSSDYDEKNLADLWPLLMTMIVKPYCLYGVVIMAQFFRNLRRAQAQNGDCSAEKIERAMNYVLEDFLEENHISMQDMSSKTTQQELSQCWRLLKECNHDYERYKKEKAKAKAEKAGDHADFMKDIKRLKEQINELNERKNKQQSTEAAAPNEKDSDVPKPTHPKEKPSVAEDVEENEEEIKQLTKEDDEHLGDKEDEMKNEDDVANKSKNGTDSSSATNGTEHKSTNSSSNKTKPKRKCKQRQLDDYGFDAMSLSYQYLYSVAQLAIFTVLGLCIKKLFFLCYTQGCVIAPTLCTRFWFRKQRDIFWTISLAVFVASIFDPGFVNINEEYYATNMRGSPETLEPMLEWINVNTERDAVFAGPIDIIGTVHLVTRRPIVNHAHLEMREMSERTEHIYSVFSRQQSSDIYNQCAQLKVQYLIISFTDCSNTADYVCDILTIWDDVQPLFRKFPQFCSELANKNVPSFLKVFSNEQYGIIKMFSQSLQINLKQNKLPEKQM